MKFSSLAIVFPHVNCKVVLYILTQQDNSEDFKMETFLDHEEKKNYIQIPVRLFMMRMAEALASSAIFALAVKLQFPRCTKMTSCASYQKAMHYTIR